MKKLLIALSLISAAGNAHAGSAGGEIGRIIVQDPATLFFTVGTIAGGPSLCGSIIPSTTEFALDLSTTAGKSQYAAILTAKALGSPVTVIGKNVCDVWPDRESVSYIVVD